MLLRLTRLFAPLLARAEMAIQGTLVVAEGEVFDPDFMLLRLEQDGYKDALPRAGDVLLLMEVADSSLLRDIQIKPPIYAGAGIADYWVADVQDESLIVHREPRKNGYVQSPVLRGGQTIAPLFAPDFQVTVRNIFD